MAHYETGVNGPQTMLPAPISSSYCLPHGSQLSVLSQTKLFSGDQYTIYNTGSQMMFDAKRIRKLGKRQMVVSDASGRPVVFIEHKNFAIHHRWDVYSDEAANANSFLFTMRTTTILSGTRSFEVFLANNQSTAPDYVVSREGVIRRKFTVHHRGSPVAEARKSRSAYDVTVNPGLDLAFVSTLVIIIDQVLKQISRASGG